MDAASVIRSAPALLEMGNDPAVGYRLDEDLIAIHGDPPGPAVATFEGDNLAVVPLASVSGVDDAEQLGPVYRQRGGSLAVPTGRVLVRFDPEDPAEAHAEALASAGFRLEEPLRYAPHAAWVRPLSDGSVEALNGLERLRSVPGVEHVEAQLLTEAARR